VGQLTYGNRQTEPKLKEHISSQRCARDLYRLRSWSQHKPTSTSLLTVARRSGGALFRTDRLPAE